MLVKGSVMISLVYVEMTDKVIAALVVCQMMLNATIMWVRGEDVEEEVLVCSVWRLVRRQEGKLNTSYNYLVGIPNTLECSKVFVVVVVPALILAVVAAYLVVHLFFIFFLPFILFFQQATYLFVGWYVNCWENFLKFIIRKWKLRARNSSARGGLCLVEASLSVAA